MKKAPSEDLSEAFSLEGVQKLKKGQLLRFNYENSMNEYIITKLNKKSGTVMARPIVTFSPDEVTVSEDYGDTKTFNEFRKELGDE